MITKSTWLDFFKENYFHNLDSRNKKKSILKYELGKRGEGFLLLFEMLIKMERSEYKIVETGTLRSYGSWGDGQSSVLFESFLKTFNGKLNSVDISNEACAVAKQYLDNNICDIVCSDSVDFLKKLNEKESVDLFYLDSYDVAWKNDDPSSSHHLKEFIEIEPFLKKGSIVAIDDNNFLIKTKTRTGKGRKIVEYLSDKGITPIYDKYQIIYRF